MAPSPHSRPHRRWVHDSSWCRIRRSCPPQPSICSSPSSLPTDSEALPSHCRRYVCCFRYVYVVSHALIMITIRRSAETKVHLPFFVFANGVCATTSQSRSFRVHLPQLPCFFASAYSLQQSLQYATTGSGSLIIPRVTCFGLTSH